MSTQDSPELTVIRDFVIAEAAHQQAKDTYNATRKALLKLLPNDIGEHKKVVDGFELTIKYPEKVVWDAAELDAIYGTDKPAHVKLSYSIDLRDLRRLPLEEQDKLKACYEVKAGTPAIDIVKDAP
jgi:hypothetical protein